MVARTLALLVTFLIVSQPAVADERSAKRLFEEAGAALDAGDPEGALDKYRQAYTQLPRAKILLNIGAVLLRLERKAEAANHFARYLAAEDADPERSRKVKAVLRRLDSKLGRLDLNVSTEGATVVVDGVKIGSTPLERSHRVEIGDHTVSVSGEDGWSKEDRVQVSAGERLRLVIVRDRPSIIQTQPAAVTDTSAGLATAVRPSNSSFEVGLFVRADIDAMGRGLISVPGMSLQLVKGWEVIGGALLGKNQGFEVGSRLGFKTGRFRPRLTAAAPVFFRDGMRPAVRGAIGTGIALFSGFELATDIGVAYAPSVPVDTVKTVVVASIGIELWL